MNLPEHTQRTVTYDVRALYIYEPMPWTDKLCGTERVTEVENTFDIIIDQNARSILAMFTEGYRNDDIAPVDVRNEEVTRDVIIDVVEPATLWDQVKHALKERWPRLFCRLSIRRSSRAVTKEVRFTVPVSRNVTVQFIDPYAISLPGQSQWRRALIGHSKDAEAIVQVLRRRAVEAVTGGP